MANKWTDAQLSAIERRDKTLLVSAAAGSGKTATLTERIIRSLTDEKNPADISRMLIATFTRASAADLREKISAALSKKLAENPQNQALANQLIALGSAHISTIDSFYYDILKTHFGRLSLSQTPRIIDEAESKPLNLSVMDDVIEEFYEKDERFDKFIENFTSVRDNSKVAEVFIDIYDKLGSQRDGIKTLNGYIDELKASLSVNLFKTKYGQTAIEKLTKFLNFALVFTDDAYAQISADEKAQNAYGDAFSADLDYWKKLSELLEGLDYDSIKAFVDTYNKVGVSQLRGKGYDDIRALKEVRTKVHEDFEKIKDNYFCYTGDEIVKAFEDNAQICSMLYRLLSEFDERIMAEKESRGICTFGDVRRYVLRILCDENGNPNEIAEEYKNRFDYIYVDEYQDVDPVQNWIFSALAKPNNRFMVGDIKQSIYGFRNADPSIFANYKKTLPPLDSEESDGYSIFMSNNFRCDKTVIDFSNAVSSFLFSCRAENIGYTTHDNLIFSKGNPNPDYVPTPAKVVTTGILPEGVSEKSLGDEDKEILKRSSAIYIAEEIERLVGKEYLADQKDDDGNIIKKKISYKDIAIFARQKKRLPFLIEELQKRGIPVECEKDSDFFENPDVLLVLSLLSTIDNPQKDISLAGALRSPFFNFTLDDIYTVKTASPKSYSLYDALVAYSENDGELAAKCKAFNEKLTYWRAAAASSPCDKLIKKLYHELALFSFGASKSRNLLRLYEYAIRFESSGFKGLYGFIKYVNELIECEVKLPDSQGGESSDSVKIMTIHHSKGLEFPVCFIFDCEKRFSTNSSKQDIQFEPSLGIGFTPHDESGFAKFNSPTWRSICDTKVALEKEEEMRLLYVAMTRARERLYVVSNIHKPENKAITKAIAKYDREYGVMRASSYADWVMMALESPDVPDCFVTEEYLFGGEAIKFDAAEEITEEVTATEITADAEAVKLLRERFDFEYSYEHISKLPAKVSVSKLTPDMLDGADAQAAALSALDEDFHARFDSDFAVPEALVSQHGATGAEIGTATHAFLQFCDFERVKVYGVKEEIARLTNERFIPKRYGELINVGQLDVFFKSELYARLSNAKRLWREQRFNIFLPAADFTQAPENKEIFAGETIAVQGVMDVFFEDENGKIVLCDYKTDSIRKDLLKQGETAEALLKERYTNQLSYYSKAIEAMLGKAPDEVIIFSLALGKEIRIDV